MQDHTTVQRRLLRFALQCSAKRSIRASSHPVAAQNWAKDARCCLPRGSVVCRRAERRRIPAAGESIAIGIQSFAVPPWSTPAQKVLLRQISGGIFRAIASILGLRIQRRSIVDTNTAWVICCESKCHYVGLRAGFALRHRCRRNQFVLFAVTGQTLRVAFDGPLLADSRKVVFA